MYLKVEFVLFWIILIGTILILIEQVTEETQTQEKKRSQPHTDNTPSPKKKKVKTYEVDLPDAPLDGMYRYFLTLLDKSVRKVFQLFWSKKDIIYR